MDADWTEYGRISNHYYCEKLEDLCVPKNGIQTGPFGSQLHKEDYVDVGTPIITVEHLLENRISHVDTPLVSDEDRQRLKKYSLQAGDIVFSRVGSVDRRSLVRGAEDGWLFSGRCLRVRSDKEKIDPAYLSYFFAHEGFKSYIRSIAVGATMPSINTKILSEVPIYYPPPAEQQVIAHILGTLDDKIELNRQMNATLEAMAQALFKSWFVDFDPVIDNALAAGNPIPEPLQARAEARRALTPSPSPSGRGEHESPLPLGEGLGEGDQRKPPPIANGCLNATLPEAIQKQFPNRLAFNEDMGWVPEGWDVSTVGDEIETAGGGTPSTKDATYWEDGIHVFCTPKDMSTLGSIVLMDTERHLTDAGVNKISSGQLPQGVVLMSSRAPIGYLAISDVPVSVNQGIIVMLPNANFGSMYLLNWAHFNMSAIKDRANGSTFLEISKKNFRPIPFLVPNGEIASFFNKQAQGVYDKLLLVSEQIRELSTIRDTLLPKLLTGQIRIPDAEALVADAT